MLNVDKQKHLLSRAGYKFELVDATEPNLLREQFPYTDPPRIYFHGREYPMDPPEDFWVTDTTFRDGQQARPPYTVKQIVDLYDLLHRLSGPNGVVRQCEFFLYSERDREAVEKCRAKGYRYPEITGWIRAVKSDFQLVKEMGLKETGILTSCSDYHIFLKLKKNRRQAMEDYLDVVRVALENNIIPRCHLEDLTRADVFGFVVPFVQALMKLAEETKIPIKIRLCDTMGYGVPYPGAALPISVPELVYTMRHYCGVPSERLEWHGHNDFHKVLINASTAWLYGCSSANGTLLGYGERTGNTPVEGLVMEYILLRGDYNGVDTTAITDIARYFEEEIGYQIPPMYPLVGKQFNKTSAGIHADGVLKSEEIYNVFDTKKVLKRPIAVGITDKSGIAGVAFWVNQHLGLSGDQQIDKRHPGMMKILEWIDKQYAGKRTTSISDEEMLEQAKLHMPEQFGDGQRVSVKAGKITA